MPKCIVHSAGGALLQHVKEHRLHGDVRPGDRLFYFTTCGWMMWNWLVSGLASQATLLLFDGSPFTMRGRVLWELADAERMTHFGTSAKYIDSLRKVALVPVKDYALTHLRAMFSTGSPLAPESFDYVYEAVKHDICLSSISGGTDIVSCFVLGNPTLPVLRGEIQCRGLGMAVEAYDEDGRADRRTAAASAGSSSARSRFRRCRWASGRIRTGRSTAPPTSNASPACGATATTSRSPRAAA